MPFGRISADLFHYTQKADSAAVRFVYGRLRNIFGARLRKPSPAHT
jgi:hypothetical protein